MGYVHNGVDAGSGAGAAGPRQQLISPAHIGTVGKPGKRWRAAALGEGDSSLSFTMEASEPSTGMRCTCCLARASCLAFPLIYLWLSSV